MDAHHCHHYHQWYYNYTQPCPASGIIYMRAPKRAFTVEITKLPPGYEQLDYLMRVQDPEHWDAVQKLKASMSKDRPPTE